MRFRLATLDDLDAIVSWRWEVASWIHSRGSDQWDTTGLSRDEFKRRITRSISAGETWLAVDESGEPVGTIAIDLVPDEGLWTDEELGRSYIIHRMMVPRKHAGKGTGAKMVEFAEDLARSHGRQVLVIDVWNTNKELHQYYERLGFRYVRTVPHHWTPSATLFEKPVSRFDHSVEGPKLTPVPFKDEGR